MIDTLLNNNNAIKGLINIGLHKGNISKQHAKLEKKFSLRNGKIKLIEDEQ